MQESPLKIRLTQAEDAPYLMQWLTDPKILRWFPMYDAREIEDSVRIWIGYSKIEACLTAEWNSEPCGMANLYIQPYKKLAHTCLFAIIVKEEMRGKGIGGKLMEELMKRAKEKFKIETLHLEVYEGNPAKKLYERLGFTEFGRQSKFIKEDGKYLGKILMQKKL
ncbi:MAG: GNAT family N-acetyltransferase [Candidatus Melainabacteria bacterium]|nr:GNAT family N-acetyltransferase [Candidatus Melainabacteria bacterium]